MDFVKYELVLKGWNIYCVTFYVLVKIGFKNGRVPELSSTQRNFTTSEILLLNISIEKLNKLLFMTARRSTFRQSRLNY